MKKYVSPQIVRDLILWIKNKLRNKADLDGTGKLQKNQMPDLESLKIGKYTIRYDNFNQNIEIEYNRWG